VTRLLPGDDGADSPELDELLPVDVWTAWLQVAADRAADRPTTVHVLAHALDVDEEPVWFLWWDRPHRGNGPLTHRASLVGATLVSACGYSTPARPELHAWEIGDRAIKDSWRTYCQHCEATAPAVLTPVGGPG